MELRLPTTPPADTWWPAARDEEDDRVIVLPVWRGEAATLGPWGAVLHVIDRAADPGLAELEERGAFRSIAVEPGETPATALARAWGADRDLEASVRHALQAIQGLLRGLIVAAGWRHEPAARAALAVLVGIGEAETIIADVGSARSLERVEAGDLRTYLDLADEHAARLMADARAIFEARRAEGRAAAVAAVVPGLVAHDGAVELVAHCDALGLWVGTRFAPGPEHIRWADRGDRYEMRTDLAERIAREILAAILLLDAGVALPESWECDELARIAAEHSATAASWAELSPRVGDRMCAARPVMRARSLAYEAVCAATTPHGGDT